MGYVTSRSGSLLVAEEAGDEQAVSHALKRLDPDLVLVQEANHEYGCFEWRVLRRMGSEHPAEHISTWRNELGHPLPLSMRLVDKVASLRRDSRFHLAVDRDGQLVEAFEADEHNRRLAEQADRQADEELWEVIDDMIPRLRGRRIPCLHRGMHLLRSRHKPGGRWYPQ